MKTIRACFGIMLITLFIGTIDVNLACAWSEKNVCHDYTLKHATGKSGSGTSVSDLRRGLKDSGFRKHDGKPFGNIREFERSAHHKEGYVIFGDKHSGHLRSDGTIDHFYGKTTREKGVQSWKVQDFIDYHRTHNPNTGAPLTKPVYPFRDVPVEFWSK